MSTFDMESTYLLVKMLLRKSCRQNVMLESVDKIRLCGSFGTAVSAIILASFVSMFGTNCILGGS